MPTKTAPRKTATPVRKRATPPPPPPPEPVPRSKVVGTVPLGDNREVRITKIPTGLQENLVRIGINLLPNGENMSGAVFPESYLDDVITALNKVWGS